MSVAKAENKTGEGIDWAKVTEYQAVIEEDQKKIDWAQKAFNIKDFIVDPDALQSKVVPGVGVVKYKLLTAGELKEYEGLGNFETGLRMFHKALSKADPTVTLDDIRNMDPVVLRKIQNAITGVDRLFLASPAPKP